MICRGKEGAERGRWGGGEEAEREPLEKLLDMKHPRENTNLRVPPPCPPGQARGCREAESTDVRTVPASLCLVSASPTKCIYLTNVAPNSLAADEVYLMAVKQVKRSYVFVSVYVSIKKHTTKHTKRTELLTALHTTKQNPGMYLGRNADFTQELAWKRQISLFSQSNG